MRRFGLIGKNISYSFSKAYFTEKFARGQMPDCSYENFDLADISKINRVMKIHDLKGLNVTIPYKEQIIPYLDSLDEMAEQIGAVNTLAPLPGGKWKGYNTDYIGFITSVQPLLDDEVRAALILGTGGASKAIAFALQSLGIESRYVSRNPDNKQLSYQVLDEKVFRDYRLIIQCTPVGTYPKVTEKPDLPYHLLTESNILYDLVYNPEETAFMKEGLKRGCKVSNGLSMLIGQAEAAWKIWNATP